MMSAADLIHKKIHSIHQTRINRASGGLSVDFYILLRFPYTASLIFSHQWISRLFRLPETALDGWKTAKVWRKIPSGVHAGFRGVTHA